MLRPLAAGAHATGPTTLVADLMADDLPCVPIRQGLASRSAARCPPSAVQKLGPEKTAQSGASRSR